LQYQLEPAWPVQAWLAECHPDRVVVRHGGRVETREQWFCEAVWDGPFERGDFDRTDIVSGSGGRLRDGGVTFVPAGGTVDRIQSINIPTGSNGRPCRTLVSNSLACMLAVAGAKINPTYRHYRREMQSIVRGLKKYKKTLETSLGPCRLWYFNNVRWDGRELTEVEKPDPQRDFSGFEPYYAFLRDTLGAVTRNAADPARRHSLGLLGTMSSGYDSTTVSTMAREFGLKEIITFDEARTHESDSGVVAARHLGLKPILVERDGWRKHHLPEVPFLTADGYAEDRFFLNAQEHLRGKLLLTGFHGDKIWGKSPYGPDSLLPHPEIKRGDCSGLTMTEFRLSVGFIHCAVPFWGARHIHEVVAISRQPEMKPWDVPGDYSRPICRRIVESAGVPREAFGNKKLAGSVCETVLSDSSRPDYRAWCDRNGIEGELVDRVIRKSLRTLPTPVRRKITYMFYGHRTPTFRDYFFPWALERRGEVYCPPKRATVARAEAPAQRVRDYRPSETQPDEARLAGAAL
jgi:hypothetical protein